MWIKPFVLFSFIVQNTVAQPEVCGHVHLTYFLTGDKMAAKLAFVPSTKLKSYRWVHFVEVTGSTPNPNFNFQEDLPLNSSKYETLNFSLIIKDLQASDNGVYNIQCETENGDNLFSSNRLNITEPYTLASTPISSKANQKQSSYVSSSSAPAESFTDYSSNGSDFDNKKIGVNNEKAKPDADLKPNAENDNLDKKETHFLTTKNVILKTDEKHTTQTDAASTETSENETAHINETGIMDTSTEGLAIKYSIGNDLNNTETAVFNEEATQDAGLKRNSENDNLHKTVTHSMTVTKVISTTDEENTTQIEASLIVTVENGTTQINVTGFVNTTTEETKSVKEKKWLRMKTFVLVGSICTVCGAIVILASVIFARKLPQSNEENLNIKTDRYDLTTINEQAQGNTYCVTVTAEMTRELQTFSDPKSSTQGSGSTSMMFIYASNENEQSEVVEQAAQNENYDNMS